MAKVFDGIDEKLAAWIRRQPLFFVATAPSGPDGHVNCSPKGPIESLHILGPRTVCYLDLVGSGIETVAHLRENGRIVIMLCAFRGPPRIVRLHGRGTVTQVGDPGFDELASRLDLAGIPEAKEGSRSIVLVELDRISDSCGYGVPLMRYEGKRPQMLAWQQRKLRQRGPHAVLDYVAEHNAESIDGLPGIEVSALP